MLCAQVRFVLAVVNKELDLMRRKKKDIIMELRQKGFKVE